MRRRAPAQAQGDAERGRARKKRQQRTAHRQEYWIRSSDAARRRSQDHARDEETKNEFKFPHMTDVDASRPSEPLATSESGLTSNDGHWKRLRYHCLNTAETLEPDRLHGALRWPDHCL